MSRKTRELAAARVEARKKASSRRNFILGAAAVGAAGLGAYGFMAAMSSPPSSAGTVDWDAGKVFGTDIVFGSPEAPVTVIEFASLTCLHCARFHAEALPGFLDGWVSPGKARLVFRHFPFDSAGLEGAAAISCMPTSLRADAVKTALTNRSWTGDADPATSLVRLLGLSSRDAVAAKSCMTGGETREKLMEPILQARRGGVSGTPSFVVGRKLYTGFMSAEALGAIVDAAV